MDKALLKTGIRAEQSYRQLDLLSVLKSVKACDDDGISAAFGILMTMLSQVETLSMMESEYRFVNMECACQVLLFCGQIPAQPSSFRRLKLHMEYGDSPEYDIPPAKGLEDFADWELFCNFFGETRADMGLILSGSICEFMGRLTESFQCDDTFSCHIKEVFFRQDPSPSKRNLNSFNDFLESVTAMLPSMRILDVHFGDSILPTEQPGEDGDDYPMSQEIFDAQGKQIETFRIRRQIFPAKLFSVYSFLGLRRLEVKGCTDYEEIPATADIEGLLTTFMEEGVFIHPKLEFFELNDGRFEISVHPFGVPTVKKI
jgi:hypothetical protein